MRIDNKSQIILFICLVLFASSGLIFNFSVHTEQQFSFLAKSFLEGKAYFVEIPQTWADTSPFAGKYFWPLGPLPAIALIPFVYSFQLFELFFYQGYMQIVLIFAIFYLVYKISGLFNFGNDDSLYLAFAFCFASVFLGVALMPWSWYFSQVVTTFLLFAFLFEFLGKKRPLVLGIIAGALLLTRVTASLIFLIYIFNLFQNRYIKSRFRKTIHLMTPYLLSLTLLFIYNYIRFGDPFEQGYAFQLIPEFADKARDIGIISFAHLPSNLYSLLLAGPLPVFRDDVSHVLKYPFITANQWGMSLFVTSPYIVFLLFQTFKDKLTRNLLIVSIIIFTPIAFYYGIGYRQFGYRYSLDFLPLLFAVFVKKYSDEKHKLSSGMKITIIISALANMYLFLTMVEILSG